MSDIVINFTNTEVTEISDQAIQDSTLLFLQQSCYSTGAEVKPNEISPYQHLTAELHRKRFRRLKCMLFKMRYWNSSETDQRGVFPVPYLYGRRRRNSGFFVYFFLNATINVPAVVDDKSVSEVTPTNASTEVVEIGSKQNYEYKSMQKLCESRSLLKSGLYVFTPKKSFPLGSNHRLVSCSNHKYYRCGGRRRSRRRWVWQWRQRRQRC